MIPGAWKRMLKGTWHSQREKEIGNSVGEVCKAMQCCHLLNVSSCVMSNCCFSIYFRLFRNEKK